MSLSTLERIEIYPFEIPLENPFRIATMLNSSAKGVFVRVLASDGQEGWGECLPFHAINGEDQATCVAALKTLSLALLHSGITDPRSTADLLESLLPSQTTAISGLEIAVYDLAARQASLPLYRLLGGTAKPLPTDLTIGIVNAEQAADKATAIAAKGYQAIKIKLGSGIAEDGHRVAAVRKAIGETIDLRVDANQGYSSHDALDLLESIAEFNIQFCEQPVRRHDIHGMQWLHGRSPVPIMADESCFSPADASQLLANKACQLLNIKLCKSGGITRASQIAAVARGFFAPCMMGGMAETRIGVSAAAHLATADGQFRFFDLDAFVGHSQDVVQGGIYHENGHVLFTGAPGHGATPTPEFLANLEKITMTA
ncbi:dipeptide epimerase [Kamptonema cortianum]|nr:dipeptide epimerase [Geitlerinema splendidum]MDK3155311.1 dipeptide epimerase [Kamptonema cortianum]